jgi:uncharacterized protein
MPVHVTAIGLGVEDLAHSKRFSGEGLGCAIDRDHSAFVSSEGSGFRGVSFHHVASSRDEVDEVMATANACGG